MAGLWKNNEGTREVKYLMKRRDGSTPSWAHFVLGERDPAAPAVLRAYANKAEELGFDPNYVSDMRAMADEWEQKLASGANTPGDPDAPRHRKDDPATIAEMAQGRGA